MKPSIRALAGDSIQLRLKNVTMRYGNHTALSNITMTVRRGDYWLVVGENGSGKSTLLKGVLGLWPLTSGSVERARGGIGYVPQSSDIEQGFPASVFEVACSGCIAKLGLRYRVAEKKKARGALEKLGIASMAARSFHELSGGQKQRVLLARALCAAESLLVLDEPDAGLDPAMSQNLYAAVHSLNRQGMTILMVSHNPDAVIGNATHVLHLGHGALFMGTSEEYLRDQASRRYTTT